MIKQHKNDCLLNGFSYEVGSGQDIPDCTCHRTNDKTLIEALEILAGDIVSDDGVASACIYEAAQRLRELTK